jgi:hypothetical protein
MNRLLVLFAWLSVTCVMGPAGSEPSSTASALATAPAACAAPPAAPRKAKQRREIPCRVIGRVSTDGGEPERIVARSTSASWRDLVDESRGEVAPPAMSRDDALARGGVARGDAIEVALQPGHDPWRYRFDADGRAIEASTAPLPDGRAYAYAFTYACVSAATASRSRGTAGPVIDLRASSTPAGPRAGERVSVLVPGANLDATIDVAGESHARLSVGEERLPAAAHAPSRGRVPAELAMVHPADPRATLLDPSGRADLPVERERVRLLVDLGGDGEPDVLLARERSGCAVEHRRTDAGWREVDRDCA